MIRKRTYPAGKRMESHKYEEDRKDKKANRRIESKAWNAKTGKLSAGTRL